MLLEVMMLPVYGGSKPSPVASAQLPSPAALQMEQEPSPVVSERHRWRVQLE